MRREPHVRFCERAGVRLPCAPHRNIYVRSRRAGERGAVPARGENRAPPPGTHFETNNDCRIKCKLLHLLGWRGYFGFCQTPRVLTNLEAWIRRRLRSYLWRQWQNGPNRFTELRRRGVPKFHAAVAAGSPTGLWRMSGHPAVQQALRNHYFDSLGLPRLHVPDPA
jgi:RNA-directed DNA polymerase